MILTVTLNPAVDKTIKISDLKIGEVNRIDFSRVDAGGKGINVSKTIKQLGGKSTALGFIGGSNGEFIREHLDSSEIENDFVRIPGETRLNTKIVDIVNNTYTDINENGPQISKEELTKIREKISSYMKDGNLIVLSGSLPKGINEDFYKEIILEANEKKCRVILDVDGKKFTEAIKAGPYLIKPNIHELEKAFQVSIESEQELIDVAKEILEYGVEYVVVSRGHEGSIMISKDKVIKAKGIKVKVGSTVGAGDSMVGALALSIEQGQSMEEALRLAAATGTANVTTEGTQSPDISLINKYLEQIELLYL
ncbi:1-phosphofructokinase [Clostridium sp. 19966]|uniref:1-phosphofructokinase n=1 Tax=Clostridium sp. 19966 TaxID=2768166 RepID=UPI0028E09A62|nr:1-phosphofructokinase [Clostridium sp. 19966]MDT8718587.1 1-phosphofructokinase [Clostridium sp. 19966]